jgi:hypothetical protein
MTAAFVPIQDSLFIILSELITAQITPQQTLQKLQSHMGGYSLSSTSSDCEVGTSDVSRRSRP